MSAAHTVALDLSQQDAIEAVTAALATQGFGVLTTIDVRATLKAKLGADVEDYTILGACNPALAHQALTADPEIGLLLPCNVTVRQAGGRTLVQAVDPAELLALAGDDVRPDDRARRRRPRRLRPPARCPRLVNRRQVMVRQLNDDGAENVVMLTGDNQATAARIAAQHGIDTVIAEVLPGDKAVQITHLQQDGRRVAMLGDGMNDAPAVAQADLGIAIGAGTDVAVETADVVLMRSNPLDVRTALQIGRGTRRKRRQNLAWAVG